VPQLTPDCDRVVVIGLQPLDGTDFNTLYVIKLYIMMMEIRVSEDYCSSDILVIDYDNLTLGHMSTVTPSYVKKFELCAFVSSTNNFSVNNDSRNLDSENDSDYHLCFLNPLNCAHIFTY
jgi:hypothetical protein